MYGRLWLRHFVEAIDSERNQYPSSKVLCDPEWTEFMKRVIDIVARRMNCYVARLRPNDLARSGEYLNIDAVFFDQAEYKPNRDYTKWDPFVLPRAVVELENSHDDDKISYCLWKILCVRAPIRVLICYQYGSQKVEALRDRIEDVIVQGSMMKGTNGDLLVIIGDEITGKDASWGEYFKLFEWRSDRLEKVEEVKW